jgi:hypothetical protein
MGSVNHRSRIFPSGSPSHRSDTGQQIGFRTWFHCSLCEMKRVATRFVHELLKFATNLDGFRAVGARNLNKTLKPTMFYDLLGEPGAKIERMRFG